MSFNISHKIFSIAIITLLLMLVVSVHSLKMIGQISDDLDSISNRQLPVAEVLVRIEGHVLKQGLFLEHELLIADGEDAAPEFIKDRLDQYDGMAQAVAQEFSDARTLLLIESADVTLGRHASKAVLVMTRDLELVQTQYDAMQDVAREVLAALGRGDYRSYFELLEVFVGRQDEVSDAIKSMRVNAENLIRLAVANADKDEHTLFMVNSILTATATLLALFFSILITRALVRGVRCLVAGAESVEAGNLDTKVAVTSKDEVGQLTGSFNAMVDGLRLKERIKDTFGKYMDPRIVNNLLENPRFTEPGGERREMTVMFIDLKGFTTIAERLSADDLVDMINRFYFHMTLAISDNGGVVDKFMGDAVMAYWGAPFIETDKQAVLACDAALVALERLEAFRKEVAKQVGGNSNDTDIDIRIGISTGKMVVGTVGSPASRSFTVMGDPVNLGARLESANKGYGTRVMISERTFELAGNMICARELDLIRVKGKVEPTRVYELLAKGGNPVATPFVNGLTAYRRKDWVAAEISFEECLRNNPGDGPATVYLERIRQLRAHPPSLNWDGVWVFESK